ncbi:MAG: MFS transporter [Proteobacteria bacterium]|nr:MFS transporter [Pseudomonadota bacterium]
MKNFIKGNILILGLVSLLNDIASDMIYPLLPLFLASLGGTPKVLGIIEGVGETTASLLKLFSGYLSDVFRKKKPLALLGYSLSNILRPFYFFANSWILVFVIRLADRVGKGIRTAPRDALIASSVSEKDRAKAFSFHRALDNLGALIGPFLAMVLLSVFNNDVKMVFLVSVIPAVIVILLMSFVKEEKIEGESKKNIFKPSDFLTLKNFSKKAKLFFLSVFVFTLGNSSDAFLIYRLKESGVETIYIPFLWGVFNLVKSIGNYPAGIIADNYNKKTVIIAGWIIYGITYLLFGVVTSKYAVISVFLFYGLYYSLTEGVERAFLADIVPQEYRGSAYGVYNFAVGISALPASLLFGFLWDRFSYKVAFLAGAIFSVFALVLFILTLYINDNKE